jgi:hypothetical protein
MQRHRFGRRAEMLPEDQMLLGLEDVEQTAASDPATAGESAQTERAARAEKRRTNRGSLPAHLPRQSSGIGCQRPVRRLGGGLAVRSLPAHHPVSPNRRFPGRVKRGRFCGDFRRYHSALPVSGDTCGLSGPISAFRLCIQNFRSRQWGLQAPKPFGNSGMSWEF